jgi:glycosyltransferase involved in cell wall biosynthesis
MKLSACLVIHNEEKLLPRCLSSIKSVVDDIVVVHDGPCSDKSLEIAKKFGAKIFTRPYVGEAEYHRPFSYQKAMGEWILQIDADEFLSGKLIKEIPSLILTENIDAYSFVWPYHDGINYLQKGPFAKTLKPCLFRKEKMYMIGISHEYPRTYGVLQKRTDLHLEHISGRDNITKNNLRNKWRKWVLLQAKQICEIEKAPVFNIENLSSNPVYLYYMNMRSKPILSGIVESLKFIVIYLTRGIFWSGWYSIKVAFFEISYIWMVRVNILKIKYER